MRPDIRRSIVCVTTVGLTAILANVLDVTADSPSTFEQRYGAYLERPSVDLRGTFRNFKPAALGGHPDFGHVAAGGAGRYALTVADALDAEAKPVLRTTGHKVDAAATDVHGRGIINAKPYVTALPGDSAATIAGVTGDAVSGSPRFWQWFRSAPGVNSTDRGAVTLGRDPVTKAYVFDGLLDRAGSRQSSADATPANTEYTYEIETTFIHRRGHGWHLEVGSNADFWAFINDTLVIDGGAGSGPQGMAGNGIIVDGSILLNSNAYVYAAPGAEAVVATNSAGKDVVILNSGCEVHGDVYIGPGGNLSTNVSVKSNSKITGDRGVLPAKHPIPSVVMPSGMPASSGDVEYTGTVTRTTDLRAKKLIVNSSGRLIISGHVRILVDEDFILNSSSDLEIAPGSSLQLWVGGQFLINSGGRFNNNTKDPGLASVYIYGTKRAEINSASGVYANILAPKAGMLVNSSSSFFGNFAGASFEANSHSSFTAINSGPWGIAEGPSVAAAAIAPAQKQRIDLDRLDWLKDGRTATLRIFFADRDRVTSRARIETTITTLNLAALPGAGPQHD